MIKVLAENDYDFSKKVRLIAENGENSIVSFKEALIASENKNLQLALMSESDIPVVKIVDMGKILFEQKKNLKKNKKAQSNKEIKFKFNITEHDLNIKLKKFKELIEDDCKVRLTLELFGREIQMADHALEIYNNIKQKIEEFSKTEDKIQLIGRNISASFVKK
jgi:translation initiation factor IF-3